MGNEVQLGATIAFETVVCGVDISPQSADAVAQGATLGAEGARLFALSAWDPGLAMHAGIHAQRVAVDLRNESLAALRRAKDTVPGTLPRALKPVRPRLGAAAPWGQRAVSALVAPRSFAVKHVATMSGSILIASSRDSDSRWPR